MVIKDEQLLRGVALLKKARELLAVAEMESIALLNQLEDKRTEEATLKREVDALELAVKRRFLEVVA